MTEWQVNRFASFCSVCKDAIDEFAGFYRIDSVTQQRKMYCTKHKAAYDSGSTTDTSPPLAHAKPTFAPTPMSVDQVAERTADMVLEKVSKHFTDHVPTIVRDELQKMVRVAEIKIGKAPPVKLDKSHKMLPIVLQASLAGASPFLVGPAGSGKTTLAKQCAKVTKSKFYFASRVTSEFKLLGFIDAHGEVVRTQFREAYEHGGWFLFDEVDASDPDAMTAFNAGLDNGVCDFPDGMVEAHADFHAIAAGNTYGRGADRQYVGRNQLDAATLDRFEIFEVDYDEQLEHEIAGNLEWSTYVQAVRRSVEQQQIRHIVSPRASIRGARMLAAGMDRKVVEESTIWKGLGADVRSRVEARI